MPPVWTVKKNLHTRRAKTQNIMCKCTKRFSFWVPQTRYRSLTAGPHWGTSDLPASLAALSGNESLCFSLRLCFSNDVCSAPNSSRIRNRRHGFVHGWTTLTKMLIPICLYCSKCTKFGQSILRNIFIFVATRSSRCQIFKAKMHHWGAYPRPLSCI